MGDLTLWDLILVPAAVCAAVFFLCWFADRHVTRGRKGTR